MPEEASPPSSAKNPPASAPSSPNSPPSSSPSSPPSSPPASPPPSEALAMERSARTRCDCPVLAQLAAEQGSVDEMVRVPAAAHGYLDRQSGKQVGSFMTYVVNFFDHAVRRRYSDFEYLHTHFGRVYPFCIVPPIPSKQSLNSTRRPSHTRLTSHLVSISAIFGGQGGGQASQVVDRRVRAFSVFLRQVLIHPVLRADHALHLFLTVPDPACWRAEVVKYAPTKVRSAEPKLPRSYDRALEEILTALPVFEEHCRSLEGAQKGVLRRLQDQLGALQQLGTAYNSFSLEYAPLAEILDAIGAAHDGEAAVLVDVVTSQQFLCEAVHEVLQTIGAIRKALRNFASPVAELQLLAERTNQLRSDVLQSGERPSTSDQQQQQQGGGLPHLEEQERAMRAEVESLRASLWEQLAFWILRLRATWKGLLLEAASAEKTFADQGLSLWKSEEE